MTTRKTHARSRRPTQERRREARLSAAAVAATAAFAGGGLLTQTVTVPHWRAMDPDAFLKRFRISGRATGATLFPVELASVVLLARTTRSAIGRDQGPKRRWSSACACMLGTVLLLPAYFARANRALLAPDFSPDDVPAELARWNRWNWLRTGMAMVATVVSVGALAEDQSLGYVTPARSAEVVC